MRLIRTFIYTVRTTIGLAQLAAPVARELLEVWRERREESRAARELEDMIFGPGGVTGAAITIVRWVLIPKEERERDVRIRRSMLRIVHQRFEEEAARSSGKEAA